MRNPSERPDRYKKWAAWAGIAVASAALGAAIGYHAGAPKDAAIRAVVLRENSQQYKYINPIVVFTIGDKENFPAYKPLESAMNSYINAAVSAGKAKKVSVYFRSLTNEAWTGINEDDKYAPSSMLKVAVLIAYLKLSETDPSILSRQIYYTHAEDPGQTFKPAKVLSTGWHTNEEVIQSMIDESDNTSVQTLIDNQKQAVLKVYADLSLPTPKSPSDIDFMSARLYSRLFRALYNGTYLSKQLSEKALAILSKTDFDGGLIAGLPASVSASHKFGERTVFNEADGTVLERQLHDCGIVYDPKSPYFICVMTRGSDFSSLRGVIADLSAIAYKSIKAAQ